MSGILRLESLTKGNTLKQGDKTPLKYRLFDADGENLNIAGKSAKVRLVYPDFLTLGYEKDGLTVAQDDTVTFTIDNVIPSRVYHVEIIVDDKFVFPSRADESKFTVDKSSLGTDANIIEIVGKDVLIRTVKSQVDTELQPLVTSLQSAQQAEAQRVLAENERSQKYASYAQQFNDVITDLSEEKDYHSLPEISGARGGHETLGQRLDETDAQLAQTDVTHHQTETVKSLPVGSKGGSVKDFEYKGQTLVNTLDNGDFSDGMTGWEIIGSPTVNVSDGYITFAPDRGGAGIGRFINQNVGDLTYIRVMYMGESLNIRLRVGAGGTVVQIVYLPTASNFTSYSFISTPSSTNPDYLSFNGNNGFTISLRNVVHLNLTQTFGAGNEPTKEEMDAMIDGYIDGMQSAKADVKTVGKNLFDVEGVELRTPDARMELTKHKGGVVYKGDYYFHAVSGDKFQVGKTYTLSYDKKVLDDGGNPSAVSNVYRLHYTDGTFSGGGSSGSSVVVTKPVQSLIIYNGLSSTIMTSEFNNIQLEEGSTATEYEPYKSSTLTAEPTLHRLPNGVADRVFEQDGELWLERNVREHVLVEEDILNVVPFSTHFNVARLSDSFLSDAKNRALWNNRLRSITLIEGWREQGFSDNPSSVGTYYLSDDFPIKFCVEIGTTTSQFKADLVGTKMLYQLDKPELINLTEQGLVTGELMSYANGTSYNNGSLKGEVRFKVPTSTGAQITSLVGSSERQAKQITVLSDHVAQLISGV